MLKKCLKYDLRAVGRLWTILSIISLGASLVGALSLRGLLESVMAPNGSELAGFLVVFGALGAIFCILAMIAALVISLFLVYWRTYTNFFTDEGYLTFTLPVKRSTLYLSKVLADVILGTATILVFILGIAIMLLIVPPTELSGLINPLIYEALGVAISGVWAAIGGWLIPWVLALIPTLIASQIYASGLVFLALTIGAAIAKKHKLLAGIGLYFAINTVVSFVVQFFTIFLSTGISGVLQAAINGGSATLGITMTIVILIMGLITACAAAVLHFITLHILERKLNLA